MKEINPNGLLGLIIKIDKELKKGKTQEEILSEYPLNKTSLPYLLTLMRECSFILSDISKEYEEIEKENIALKEQIKRLESQKGDCKGLDSEELQNKLERLKIENNQLKEDIRELKNERNALRTELADLRMDVESYQRDLKRYEKFFQNNSFCLFFYRRFLRKVIK